LVGFRRLCEGTGTIDALTLRNLLWSGLGVLALTSAPALAQDLDGGAQAAAVSTAADAGAVVAGEPDEAGLESLLSETISSSASRSAERASEAPATTWSISGTDLKRFGIQSVEEAIRFLGHGMTSYESDSRQNASFGARGYLSNQLGLHFAVLVDGNQAGGSAKTGRGTQPYMLPIELVDHIELVLGPGSVLYGNSAMLGIVNVITKSPASLKGEHAVVVQGELGAPGDNWAKNLSWGETWTRAAVYGGESWMLGGDPFDLAWHFAVRFDRHEGRSIWRPLPDTDIFTANPVAVHTREDVFNRDLRTKLFARATWGNFTFLGWVGLAGGSGTGPIPGLSSSSYLEPEYGLDVKWAKHVGERGDLSLRAYGVVWDARAVLPLIEPDAAHCAAYGAARCDDTLHYLNFRPFLEPTFAFDWAKDGSHVSTIGAQLFVDGSVITSGTASSDGKVSNYDEPIVAPIPNAALFGQHIWRARYGTLNLGVRGDLGFIGSAVSPRAAYTVSPWENGTVKLIVSTGFRTPTITERYLKIDKFLTDNPDIQPEHVYSAEVDVGQRFGLQSLQASVFATSWQGLITTRGVVANGQSVSQFANLRNVLSAGVNVGWQGASSNGLVEYSLSLNYSPGRVQLPGDIASYTDAQLKEQRLLRSAIQQFGTPTFGSVFVPAEGMPDFYGTGHISIGAPGGGARVSLAAQLNSPRMRVGWLNDETMIDPRNVDGAVMPWSVDVRAAVEGQLSERVGWRLVLSARSLSTVADSPRVGDSVGPVPTGGVGVTSNPQAPVSGMLELGARF